MKESEVTGTFREEREKAEGNWRKERGNSTPLILVNLAEKYMCVHCTILPTFLSV